MKHLIAILCLAAIAGCGEPATPPRSVGDIEDVTIHPLLDIEVEAGHTIEVTVDGLPRYRWDTDEGKWVASNMPPVVTREQLAGIYRRLVELEKRAGIRDAEWEKVEASNILMGDTTTNPKSLQEIDREYRESQEPPHHGH